VDRERTKGDARAVEDPIAAIFDLAESVDRQTPKIRKTLRYVRWFVSVWLLLDFFLIILSAAAFGGAPGLALILFVPIVVLLLAMRSVSGSTGRLVLLIFVLILGVLQVMTTGGLVFLGAVLVALFILGFSILELMRDLRSFFDYFALRHRVIQRVRQADPVVYVPEGKDAVQRILIYLGATSSDVRGMMAVPGAIATPAAHREERPHLLVRRLYSAGALDVVAIHEPRRGRFRGVRESVRARADARGFAGPEGRGRGHRGRHEGTARPDPRPLAIEERRERHPGCVRILDERIGAGQDSRLNVRLLPGTRDRAGRWHLRLHPCRGRARDKWDGYADGCLSRNRANDLGRPRNRDARFLQVNLV